MACEMAMNCHKCGEGGRVAVAGGIGLASGLL